MAVKTNYKKNGQEYFRVTKTIGKNSDGSPIRKEFYGKSKKEAESKRDEYLKGLNSGLNIDYREISLGEFMHIWLFEVVKMYASYATFEKYEGIYRNYIKNTELNPLKIYNIKPLTLQTYYNKIYDSGVSSSQIFNLNKLLKTFFYYTIREGYILTNPCFKIIIPRDKKLETEQEEVDPFTEDEIKKIIDYAEDNMYMIILLDLGTGLRKGELLGLRFKDIDLINKEIHISHALKKIKDFNKDESYVYKTIIDTTKTKGSIRIVPIPSNLIKPLKLHILKQKEKFLSNGLKFAEDNFIFTTNTCNPLDGRNISRSWERLLKKADIRYRKFHNIRHTYATKLFNLGVDLKTVQKLLGHSNLSTTADIYTHVMKKVKIEAVEKIDYLFEL